MFSRRLSARLSNPPKVITKATLQEYGLCFHKKSTDGSGKCTIMRKKNTCVHGIVFGIDESGRIELDRIEGVGSGYATGYVMVSTKRGLIRSYTYIASEEYIDRSLVPYSWYKTLVLEGAKEHELPEYYVSAIRETKSCIDIDYDRVKRNLSVLK